ncbi:MAG: hypothetical protein RLZZ554_290, partial [Actinomycetota bacterium]
DEARPQHSAPDDRTEDSAEAAAKKGEPEPSVADADRIADLVNAGEPIGKGCPIGKEHEPDCPNCCPGPTWHGSTVPEGLAATPKDVTSRGS